MNINDLLEIRFNSDAGDGLSIREYLKALLITLWRQPEAFSGKRPFGNGGWEYDIYTPLVRDGVLKGSIDDSGYLDDVDEKAGHDLVLKMIDAIFNKETN